jgi:hypothetical protein
MDRETLSRRLGLLRAEVAALAGEVARNGGSLSREECFALAGEVQGLVNAAEGAQGVLAALGARVETTMWESRPWERVHPVGYVDAMASSEMSLATGLTDGLAGRKVALGAALSARFPAVRALVLAGDLPTACAQKVVDACAGLDDAACAQVDAEVADRLPTMDPARVRSEVWRTAARVAADQMAAHAAATRRSRTVEVRPGVDGLSDWFAMLPTATSAAMWAAVEEVAARYRELDDSLDVPSSRADALADLVLRGVDVSASVTLGVPVVLAAAGSAERPASQESARPGGTTASRVHVDWSDDDTVVDAVTGEVVRIGDLTPASREALSWLEAPGDEAPPDARFTEQAHLANGVAVSGCELPGLGVVPAEAVAGMLRTLPLAVTRALLDADTGTVASVTTGAYTPTRAMREFVTARDGTRRMWGCSRPADRVDLDHTRPWPTGPTSPTNLAGLCRRHHRLKQQGRWRYRLDPDGTVTWTGPSGQVRVTEPTHRLPRPRARTPSPPHRAALTPAEPPPF